MAQHFRAGCPEHWQNQTFNLNKQAFTLLSSYEQQTPCLWPGLSPLQGSVPLPWWTPSRFLTCRFAGWTAQRPSPWTRPHLQRSRQHYKKTNTRVTHFSTHTRAYIYFCEAEQNWATDGYNISINYVDLDMAVYGLTRLECWGEWGGWSKHVFCSGPTTVPCCCSLLAFNGLNTGPWRQHADCPSTVHSGLEDFISFRNLIVTLSHCIDISG